MEKYSLVNENQRVLALQRKKFLLFPSPKVAKYVNKISKSAITSFLRLKLVLPKIVYGSMYQLKRVMLSHQSWKLFGIYCFYYLDPWRNITKNINTLIFSPIHVYLQLSFYWHMKSFLPHSILSNRKRQNKSQMFVFMNRLVVTGI